jgi:hypothetical protein
MANNRFQATLRPRSRVADSQRVRMDLFDMEGNPVEFGGGAPEPVYGRVIMNFLRASSQYIPSANLDLSVRHPASTLVGATVDPSDHHKLQVPAGVYVTYAYFSLDGQSQTPTWFQLAPQARAAASPSSPMLPSDLNVRTGAGSADDNGRAIPFSNVAYRRGWCVGNNPFWFYLNAYHDSPQLSGSLQFDFARVEAL